MTVKVLKEGYWRREELSQILIGRLIVLQQDTRSIREDFHDNAEIDTELNSIEARLGTMIEKARGGK